MKNILDYLEEQADRYPDKIIFEEAEKQISYQQFRKKPDRLEAAF